MYPIAYLLSLVLDKLLGEELQTLWSKKEIREIIKDHGEGEGEGEDADLDKDEERILLGALSFSDITVKKVMTPKLYYSL